MIARELPYDDDDTTPRLRVGTSGVRVNTSGGTRAGRGAVATRRAATRRKRYAVFANMFAIVGALTLAIVIYLALMANVVWLNYRLVHAQAEKASLLDATARLDRRIAEREAPERLAIDAARLGMHEPNGYAEVDVPPSVVPRAPRGLALLEFWSGTPNSK